MIKLFSRGTSFSFLFFVLCHFATAQVNYDVKIMSWNILNFPNSTPTTDSTLRCPYYRTVVNYVQPDILVTMENTSATGASWILSNVMNTGAYHYAQGTFINGYDSDNAIYFRDSLFEFISNQPIATALRDISHFTLKFIPTGDTLHLFAVHLKASLGYEQNRADEVTLLRNVTNAFPDSTNFLVMGDFNIYSSFEPAYTNMLQNNLNDDGNFIDPLTLSGTWNFSAFARYHTQSTRLTSVGGGSTGGMNDRFDMILFSTAVQQPRGVYFLQGSYNAVGNDGQHFDQSINNNVNTAVPVNVANALYGASDHLPVQLTLQIGPTTDIESPLLADRMNVFPNPSSNSIYVDLMQASSGNMKFTLFDLAGRQVQEFIPEKADAGRNIYKLDLSPDVISGLYLLSIGDGKSVINKRLAVFR